MNFEKGKPHILPVLYVKRLSQSTASFLENSEGTSSAIFAEFALQKFITGFRFEDGRLQRTIG